MFIYAKMVSDKGVGRVLPAFVSSRRKNVFKEALLGGYSSRFFYLLDIAITRPVSKGDTLGVSEEHGDA